MNQHGGEPAGTMKGGTMAKYRQVAISLIVVAVAFSAAGCDRLVGHRLEVVFRTVDGLESGAAVYLRGIRIGTTGTPFLRDGSAVVPVYVRDLSALPSRGVVFLLSVDPHDPNRKGLLGFSLGSDSVISTRPRLYQGASNELELVLLVGASKAKQLLNEIGGFLGSVIRQ
jgi:hypothetical protein